MEQKLTNSQVTMLMGIARQKSELSKAFSDLVESEQELTKMLAEKYGLDGDYVVEQRENDVFLVEAPQQPKGE